jgi:hypothetical protein
MRAVLETTSTGLIEGEAGVSLQGAMAKARCEKSALSRIMAGGQKKLFLSQSPQGRKDSGFRSQDSVS